MSKSKNREELFTTLKNETFLLLADHSQMGITLIRRGYLLYFNKQFLEMFGYTKKDIRSWKKFEYYKIFHPEDIPHFLERMTIEDKYNAVLKFRGVKKNGDIISIDNYINRIRYKDKFAFFSTYIQLDKSFDKGKKSKKLKMKEDKKILLNYHPNIVKLLKENNIAFQTIQQRLYREE